MGSLTRCAQWVAYRFSRIRACTQFIKENQRSVITLINHINYCTHVAGKCGKALCNGLFVTNIRQNPVEG